MTSQENVSNYGITYASVIFTFILFYCSALVFSTLVEHMHEITRTWVQIPPGAGLFLSDLLVKCPLKDPHGRCNSTDFSD